MDKKIWSVKCFQWEDVENSKYKVKHQIRKLVLLGKGLNWKAAKELRNKYSKIGAYISPFKEEKLRVIKLS